VTKAGTKPAAKRAPQKAPPMGRRERNKQEKLDRILAAAKDLFAAKGFNETTTQEIADRADIGTGDPLSLRQDQGRPAHHGLQGRDDRDVADGLPESLIRCVR